MELPQTSNTQVVDETFWESIRAAYPRQQPLMNLNNAAVSPPPLRIDKFDHWSLGTYNSAVQAGIAPAIAFHKEIGVRKIHARLQELTRYWVNLARDIPGFRLHTPLESDELELKLQTNCVSEKNASAYVRARHAVLGVSVKGSVHGCLTHLTGDAR